MSDYMDCRKLTGPHFLDNTTTSTGTQLDFNTVYLTVVFVGVVLGVVSPPPSDSKRE